MRRLTNPSLMGMRASMLLFLYRRRLRAHPVQELLAGAGIAVGVALVFGVLLANASLTNSAGRLVHGLIGSARLSLSARSPSGLSERTARRVGRLSGVQAAAPVLREPISVWGPRGHERVQLVGVDSSLASLGGAASQQIQQGDRLLEGGIVLPVSVAHVIGAGADSHIAISSRGYAHPVTVVALVGSAAGLAALAASPVAVASLSSAQRLTGMPGRVTQVLVQPRPGEEGRVAARLRGLAGGRLDVTSADNELRLLSQATQPNRQSTFLFSAISIMVGFLLALTAVLLTVPERRRFIAELRMQGYAPSQVLLLLLFEAVVLGLVASAAGVVLGAVLSRALFEQVPGYLSVAFPLGSTETIALGTVLASIGCGVAATVLMSLSPAFDLRPHRAPDVVFRDHVEGGETIPGCRLAGCTVGATLLMALVAVFVRRSPQLTILAGVALALVTLFLIPAGLTVLARLLPWATSRTRSGAVVVAVSELRATSARSVALAGIAGLAVYGGVAIGGTRADLLHGIDEATMQYHDTANVWVTSSGDIFNTDSFPVGGLRQAIGSLPQVSAVRPYYGGLSDIGRRRVWVRARSSGDSTMVEPSQVMSGDARAAQTLLRRRGWAAVSSSLAAEQHLHVGGVLELSTPAGAERARVAAITTNSGWPAGTITLAAADYRSWWRTDEVSALEVSLRAGMDPRVGTRAVRGVLGSRTGLEAKSSNESVIEAQASARQGLATLGQISTLLLIAAGLAVAAALSAIVWQRRARLASLKIQGYDPSQLWRGLLLESAVMLSVGSAAGALVGVYGHALASRWLELTTSFPAPFAVRPPQVFLTLGLITAIALAVIAVPGMVAARVPARLSLQD
jgi:putative ABC transport system permease protein